MKKFPLFISAALIILAVSCKKKDSAEPEVIIDPVDTATIPSFNGPSYSDNYTPIANWANRSQWNLANVHDPTVEKCGDYFYMYQTDASYGNAHEGYGHYPYRRSKDLVNWEFSGMAFSAVPAWIKDSLNIMRARMTPALPAISNPSYGFWAPCVRKVGNKYRMYYSVVVTNPIVGTDPNTSWSERAFIGLAETDDLATNNWTDKGMVICSVPDGLRSYNRSGGNDWNAYFNFNAIDPSFIVAPNEEQYLIYGSWHSGIAAVKIDPATGKPYKLQTLSDYGVRIAGRGNVNVDRWQGMEAPEIVYNENTGYYYLFVAYDELGVAYNTRVARSTSITGPFLGIDGKSVTDGAECYPIVTHPYKFNSLTSPGWVGISHCAVFQDPQSKEWYYASQGRLPENVPGINASNAVMMGHVRSIKWTEDGWPVVMPERYAAVPEKEITEQSLVGSWEQIVLKYQYRTMQTSSTITLKADKTVGGAMSGNWSFDKTKSILTINTLKVNVQNGWDWESSPRKLTLTFSGINASGQSVWGKRVQ